MKKLTQDGSTAEVEVIDEKTDDEGPGVGDGLHASGDAPTAGGHPLVGLDRDPVGEEDGAVLVLGEVPQGQGPGGGQQ